MEHKPNNKLEKAAYIAIIILCLVASVSFAKTYLFPPSTVRSESGIMPGTAISLKEDWQQSRKTLLLVLSETCHFCNESAPFYRELTARFPDRTKVRFVAVFPQDDTSAKTHLSTLGVSVDEVRQATPSSLGAQGTPTLILLDSNGRVIESWVGKLSQGEEAKVSERIEAN